jgi:bifunctional enzyme CysN/CysC
MPWYAGPTLMEHLEDGAEVDDALQQAAVALPVQWVNRPNQDFRGFCRPDRRRHVRPGDGSGAALGPRERVARIVTAGATCRRPWPASR